MFSIFNFQFSIFSCMKNFEISETDKAILPDLIDKINNLTKPKGSLGLLERTGNPDRADSTDAFSGIEKTAEYNFCRGSWDREGRG